MVESQGEIVRKKIAKKLSDKINLNDFNEKKKMTEELEKENPTFKKSSIQASISRFLKTEQSKTGQDFGSKLKPRYDDSLSVKNKDGSTRIKNQNPLLKNNDNPESELKKVDELGNYPKTTCESVGGMMYSMFSISDEDMEGLTEQERKDVGEMLKPLLDRYANGERGAVIISLGAIMGLFVNKKRLARAKRKERKKLANQGNKETQKEFPADKEPTTID